MILQVIDGVVYGSSVYFCMICIILVFSLSTIFNHLRPEKNVLFVHHLSPMLGLPTIFLSIGLISKGATLIDAATTQYPVVDAAAGTRWGSFQRYVLATELVGSTCCYI